MKLELTRSHTLDVTWDYQLGDMQDVDGFYAWLKASLEEQGFVFKRGDGVPHSWTELKELSVGELLHSYNYPKVTFTQKYNVEGRICE